MAKRYNGDDMAMGEYGPLPRHYNDMTMAKVRQLRALANLGANTNKLHKFADALAGFDGMTADELHSIAAKIERSFEAMVLPSLI